MRRFVWIGLGAALFLASFWLGLMWSFPGAALAGYLASQWRAPGLSVQLAPVRFTGWALHSDTLQVRAAGTPSASLLVLTDLSIPVLRLPGGVALHATLGRTGRLNAEWPWSGGQLDIRSANLNLDDIPALSLLHGIAMRGQVSMQAHLAGPLPAPGDPQGVLPDGTISAHAEDVQLSQLNVAGTALPPVRLRDLTLRARTGRSVAVEGLSFAGDVQGSVTGTIVPEWADPLNSRLNLRVTTTLDAAWMNQLGALRAVLQSLMHGDRLETMLTGTLRAPNLQPVTGSP
ncbi:MAG TPA: type II secretion system protein GspN [bacterium]|nr:type II secretion system protein GspN [bacterium]